MTHAENTESTFLPVRPPGPLKVWSIVDGVKKDEEGKQVKFIIQEIPEDRFEDVLDHMCTYFIADEPMCKCQNGKDDPEYVQTFRTIWSNLLKERLSVAAFVEDPNGGKPIIAGINMLAMDYKDRSHGADDFEATSEKARNVLEVMMRLTEEAKVFEKYNIDKYMYAFGLSVNPSYRGQALGGHLLKARINIGQAYKIPVTSTAFSSPISQKLAARCGFEVLLHREYAQIKDDKGNEVFPNIGVKDFKIMARRLY